MSEPLPRGAAISYAGKELILEGVSEVTVEGDTAMVTMDDGTVSFYRPFTELHFDPPQFISEGEGSHV